MPHRYDKIISKLKKRPLSQNEFWLLLDEVGGLLRGQRVGGNSQNDSAQNKDGKHT